MGHLGRDQHPAPNDTDHLLDLRERYKGALTDEEADDLTTLVSRKNNQGFLEAKDEQRMQELLGKLNKKKQGE